jgi:hypothetical protein
MIDLYYWPTPQWLEGYNHVGECGLPYMIKPVNIGRGTNFLQAFSSFCPMGGCLQLSITNRSASGRGSLSSNPTPS